MVRHLYDLHAIAESRPDVVDEAKAIFPATLERDRENYGNSFPPFQKDPEAVLRTELEWIGEQEVEDCYRRFCQTMIYGEVPNFQVVRDSFQDVAHGFLS